jgi:hypothetical protein
MMLAQRQRLCYEENLDKSFYTADAMVCRNVEHEYFRKA